MNSIDMLINNLSFSFFSKKKYIAIVYYVYINPDKDWKRIILGQIDDIKKTKILSVADLYIVVSNPFGVENVEMFFGEISSIYKNIEFHRENRFEYWGISFIWRLAQESKRYKYLIYFHTKGMTHNENARVITEEILTYYTFHDWKFFVKVLEKNSKINKIGLFPAWKINDQCEILRGGWIWYNFWWARADYVKILEQPKIDPKHRYYYEEWLSCVAKNNINKFHDGFSIYNMDISSYTNKETLENMKELIERHDMDRK